jgi:hypothetical protein
VATPRAGAPEPAGSNKARTPRPAEIVTLWTECPWGDVVTEYDLAHLVLFNRLLDAENENVDEFEMARSIFRIDSARHPNRAWRVVHSHLARAHWLMDNGFPLLNW